MVYETRIIDELKLTGKSAVAYLVPVYEHIEEKQSIQTYERMLRNLPPDYFSYNRVAGKLDQFTVITQSVHSVLRLHTLHDSCVYVPGRPATFQTKTIVLSNNSKRKLLLQLNS